MTDAEMRRKKGLIYCDINANEGAVIDPDNVFWAIVSKNMDSGPLISRELLSLYDRVKIRLDTQLRNFRFSTDLAAIYIDPTDRCNASCSYCYVPAKIRRDGTQMNREQLFYVLSKITGYFKARKKKAVIVFHASEPLLVKEIIFEAIKKFSERFNFGLQTNAILLEKEDVEFLKRYGVGVGVSLDSFDSEVNNRLRPSAGLNGNFSEALRALEWFDGYDGLNVITTITKFNVHQLPGLVRFLHSKRVKCVLLNPVRLTQRPARNLKPEEKLLTKYFIEAIDTAIELSMVSRHRIIIGNFANIILGIIAPTARRLMCDISPCGGGRCFLTITASGDMIPCGEFIGLSGFSAGNIFKTSISSAMQSKPFKSIRSRIVERIPECKACIFRNICGAPCPAELYSLGNMYPVRKFGRSSRVGISNGMYRPSIFCEFYKRIIKYALGLIAMGKEKYLLREESLKNLEYEYKL